MSVCDTFRAVLNIDTLALIVCGTVLGNGMSAVVAVVVIGRWLTAIGKFYELTTESVCLCVGVVCLSATGDWSDIDTVVVCVVVTDLSSAPIGANLR